MVGRVIAWFLYCPKSMCTMNIGFTEHLEILQRTIPGKIKKIADNSNHPSPETAIQQQSMFLRELLFFQFCCALFVHNNIKRNFDSDSYSNRLPQNGWGQEESSWPQPWECTTLFNFALDLIRYDRIKSIHCLYPLTLAGWQTGWCLSPAVIGKEGGYTGPTDT